MNGAGAFFLDLRAAGHVQISIHDLQGRRIQTLLDRWIERGGRQINWDGRDALGLPVPSGTYYAYLRQGGVEVRRRFTMIR
jgi:flagellar hook assembly protein FlgD